MSFDKIEDMVEDILKCYPETRNDDRLLTIKFWELMQGVKFEENFRDMYLSGSVVSSDIITRMRRRIQNSRRLYEPTDSCVRSKRGAHEREFRDKMPLKSPIDDNW